MGYFDTNKLVALAVISLVMFFFIWKFDPLLGGGWSIMQKLILSCAGVFIPGYIIWSRE
jgi:hypothetical protein